MSRATSERMRDSVHWLRSSLALALGLAPLAACQGNAVQISCPDTKASPDPNVFLCEDGVQHRPEPGICNDGLPRGNATCSSPASGTPGCATDADCTAKPHGFCSDGDFQSICACQYGCLSDADCTVGQACICGAPVGRCVDADCRGDADCDAGFLCLSYTGDCGSTGFACQTDDDECATDAQCGANRACLFGGGARECVEDPVCAIGRPFLVAGEDRKARLVARRDWADRSHMPSSTVPTRLLPALARRWSAIALMEHASIAAFARLQLQLLALGAPPDLVEKTTRAMADETRHAKLAFGIAAAYGSEVGPGPLAIDRALEGTTLLDVVRDAVREGCIGETVAAAEAREGAAVARDADVQAVLSRIAEDESSHAALAWATIGWALGVDREGVERVVDEELALAMRVSPVEEDGPDLTDHGLLTGRERAMLRAELLPSVVRPMWTALAARVPRASAA